MYAYSSKTSFVSCAIQQSRTINPTSSSASTTQQHIPKKKIIKKKTLSKKTLSKKNRPPCQVHGQYKSVLSICALSLPLPAHTIGFLLYTKEKNTSKKYKQKIRAKNTSNKYKQKIQGKSTTADKYLPCQRINCKRVVWVCQKKKLQTSRPKEISPMWISFISMTF